MNVEEDGTCQMNPYRIETDKQESHDKPNVVESDCVLAWLWLAIGVILIMTDVGQPGPWGAWSSLGMLISGLAIVALTRHYATGWKRSSETRQSNGRDKREV